MLPRELHLSRSPSWEGLATHLRLPPRQGWRTCRRFRTTRPRCPGRLPSDWCPARGRVRPGCAHCSLCALRSRTLSPGAKQLPSSRDRAAASSYSAPPRLASRLTSRSGEKVLLTDFCNRPSIRTLVDRTTLAQRAPLGVAGERGPFDDGPRASVESSTLPEEGAPHRAAPSRRGVFDRERRLAIPPLTPPSRQRRSRVNPVAAAGAKTASADLTSMRAASPAGVPSIDRCSHDGSARDDLGRPPHAGPARTLLSLASDGSPPPVSWLCRLRPGVRRRFAFPMALAREG